MDTGSGSFGGMLSSNHNYRLSTTTTIPEILAVKVAPARCSKVYVVSKYIKEKVKPKHVSMIWLATQLFVTFFDSSKGLLIET